jgi:hypothetical protein
MMNGVGDESRVPSFSILFFLIKDIPFLFFYFFFYLFNYVNNYLPFF